MGNNRSTNLKGEAGSDYITDTALHNDQIWDTIECIADCTFTMLTDGTCNPSACNSITLAAGGRTFGTFTAIQLATGKIKAYRK